jgi:hypothetical protein
MRRVVAMARDSVHQQLCAAVVVGHRAQRDESSLETAR